MALDIDYTLVVNSGNYFTAPVGTALPGDLTTIGAPWTPIGHTSLDEILAFASEGGDKTVLGTLQAKNARTTYSTKSESFDITLQQFDTAALKLYYGSDMVDVLADGSLLGVPQSPTPTEAAFLAVFYDGESVFAIYAPRAEIFRGDDIDIQDTENFAGLPLTVTPLIYGTNTWPYAVTPLDAAGGAHVPVINSVAPAAQGTGKVVQVLGAYFTGTTGVTVGGTAVGSFTVISDNALAITIPTGSAGPVNVVVTTAAGASDAFSYTRA